MTFNLFALSGAVIAISSGIMALVMFALGRTFLHRLWGVFCVSVFIWGLGGFLIGTTQDLTTADFWWRITHIGVAFIPTLFLHFVYVFLDLKERKTLIAFYIISIVFSVLALDTNLLIAHMRFVFGQFYYDSPPGLLYPLFTTYFFGLTVYSHYVLYRSYRQEKLIGEKTDIKQARIRYFFLGMLISFAGGSMSFLPVYRIDVYPITNIAVVLYPIIVGYAILKHRLFDIRVAVAQGLIFLLWAFVGVRVVLSTTPEEFYINGVLWFAVIVLGIYLVRSIGKEVAAREHIEQLATELEETNKRQEVLFHFVGHEVKGFLTKDEGAFAALLDGDFGVISDPAREFVTRALAQTREGVSSVTDILKASNQKKGTTEYKKEVFDLKALTSEAVENARHLAAEKGLTFTFSAGDSPNYQMTGDKAEIGDHVLRNLIENAINYTPSGSVGVLLKKEGNRYVIAVKDTGIGITEEDKKRLFTEGGHGKDSQKVNVHSTGYGLFIAKNIAEAHGGTIRAESEGQGKGSTFVVELPA